MPRLWFRVYTTRDMTRLDTEYTTDLWRGSSLLMRPSQQRKWGRPTWQVTLALLRLLRDPAWQMATDKQLAQQLSSTRGSVSVLLVRLRRQGLVEPTPQLKGRKKNRLPRRLTPRGEALLDRVEEELRRANALPDPPELYSPPIIPPQGEKEAKSTKEGMRALSESVSLPPEGSSIRDLSLSSLAIATSRGRTTSPALPIATTKADLGLRCVWQTRHGRPRWLQVRPFALCPLRPRYRGWRWRALAEATRIEREEILRLARCRKQAAKKKRRRKASAACVQWARQVRWMKAEEREIVDLYLQRVVEALRLIFPDRTSRELEYTAFCLHQATLEELDEQPWLMRELLAETLPRWLAQQVSLRVERYHLFRRKGKLSPRVLAWWWRKLACEELLMDDDNGWRKQYEEELLLARRLYDDSASAKEEKTWQVKELDLSTLERDARQLLEKIREEGSSPG